MSRDPAFAGSGIGIPATGAGSADKKPMPRWMRYGVTMAAIAAVLIVIEVVDTVGGGDLDDHGIVPRSTSGLLGILWAPFLHVGFGHLLANLGAGVVLGYVLLFARRFLAVTAIVWLTSGIGVWLTAPSGSVTLGASGVVFGWLAYLLVRGIFNRSAWQLLVGAVLLLIYGGVLWGLLPTTSGVSWQGHLFGFAGGVLAAWALADRPERSSTTPPPHAGGGLHPGGVR